MSSVTLRPWQLLSHMAHRWVVSGSYSSSITELKVLAMVEMRLNESSVRFRA